MSTKYRDAAKILQEIFQENDDHVNNSKSKASSRGSFKRKRGLKSLILDSKVKNKPFTHALVCETIKFKPVIDRVLKNAGLKKRDLAKHEGTLYVLLYEHLFGKGIQGGGSVKRAILKHKAGLEKALAQLKTDKNVTANVELLSEQLRNAPNLPRYARVNLLKTDPSNVMKAFGNKCTTDEHIPYIVRFEPNTDLHNHSLVIDGSIILQDKSSCFPAHILYDAIKPLLDNNETVDLIDATAAPGNKTSQLASLIKQRGVVFAFDKSPSRLNTLKERMIQASAHDIVSSCCKDFLTVDPNEPKYQNVKGILVDPSCSGSGMISRLDHLADEKSSDDHERLKKLAKFQVSCVKHALSFPSVKYVTYSTCSIHKEENESVVMSVLDSCPDFDVKYAFPNWNRRGLSTQGLSVEQSNALVRVDPQKDLTNGFFVALFVRKAVSVMSNKKRKMRERRKRRRKHKSVEKAVKKLKPG